MTIAENLREVALSIVSDLSLNFNPIETGENTSIIVTGDYPSKEDTLIQNISCAEVEIGGALYNPQSEEFFEKMMRPVQRTYSMPLNKLHQRAFDTYCLFMDIESNELDSTPYLENLDCFINYVLTFENKLFCKDYLRFWREFTGRVALVFEQSINGENQHPFTLHFNGGNHSRILSINNGLNTNFRSQQYLLMQSIDQ